MIKPDKELLINGAGAGVGLIQTLVTKTYDKQLLPQLGTWGNLSTIGNILIGGAIFGITGFTNIIKNYTLKEFLELYGLTTLIGGFMNGILPTTISSTSAKAVLSNTMTYSPQTGYIRTVPMSQAMPYYTDEYYPGYRGTFYRRPESKAQGFASDVTVNPKAAIPTTIPENKFLS